MNEYRAGDISYYLKVTAVGGEEWWSGEKVFRCYCGVDSTQVVMTDLNQIFEYPLET